MGISMKKLIIGAASTVGFALSAIPALADTTVSACPTTSQFALLCNLDADHLQNIVGPAITFVFVIATIIALAYLIWGGIKWIISQGDKQGVEDARNHIIAAIIGLVLVFFSYLVINLVLGFFTNGATLNNLQLPHLQR